MAFSKNLISEEEAKGEIAGIVDVYLVHQLIISEISSSNLNDEVYQQFRERAERALNYYASEKMLEENLELFELPIGLR